MEPWNLKRLVGLVREKVSKEAASLVERLTFSIAWKLGMAAFHAERAAETARNLVSDGGDRYLAAAIQLIKDAEPGSDGRMFVGKFEIEADTIACAQALHSAVDLFGPILYEGLGLEAGAKRLKPRHQTPWAVLGVLKRGGNHPGIAAGIEALLSSPTYRYLRAYVNTTKHRSLVPAPYAVSLQEDRTYGVRIEAFEYDGAKLEARWATEITIEYRRLIVEAVISLGLELNRALEAAEMQPLH